MDNTLVFLVENLLLENKISFDKAELNLQIKSYPSYPSLHAITGVLDHFGIENLALDIPQNNEVYNELPTFFLAQIKNKESEDFVFVTKKEHSAQLTYVNHKKERVSQDTFLQKWTGIVLVIDKEDVLNGKTVKSSYFNKTVLVLFGFSSLFLLFKVQSFSLTHGLQITLSIIGLYIAYLLVKHDLGLASETVEKLCTQSKNTSCDAVLHSKVATVLGLFKLSDVSFVYFTSLTFLWIINGITTTSFSFLMMLSLSAIPMVIYSIYYQAVIVKKWCPLCLATASVLIAQAMGFIFNLFTTELSVTDFMMVALIFSLVTIVYSFIKPLISQNLILRKKEMDFYKFKRNYKLFEILHHQNSIINTNINNVEEIVLGNNNASTELLLVTNPLCGYCKVKHQDVDKLLKTNKENIKVIIRFNIHTHNPEDMSYKISTVLINLYQKDKELCKKALNQIYSNDVNLTQWLNTYKKFNDTLQLDILESQKKWCVENNINFTPAIYLNQQEYPKEYNLSDLSLFLEEIIEEQTLNNNIIRVQDEVVLE